MQVTRAAAVTTPRWTSLPALSNVLRSSYRTVPCRSPKPEARSPKPEARSPKPEARSPKPEARSPKPEARSPKPEARRPSAVRTAVQTGGLLVRVGPCRTSAHCVVARCRRGARADFPEVHAAAERASPVLPEAASHLRGGEGLGKRLGEHLVRIQQTLPLFKPTLVQGRVDVGNVRRAAPESVHGLEGRFESSEGRTRDLLKLRHLTHHHVVEMPPQHLPLRSPQLVAHLGQRPSVAKGVHQLIERIDGLPELHLEGEAALPAPFVMLETPLLRLPLLVQLALLKQLNTCPARCQPCPRSSTCRTRESRQASGPDRGDPLIHAQDFAVSVARTEASRDRRPTPSPRRSG